MAPPAEAAKPSQPAASPFDLGDQPAPTAAPAETTAPEATPAPAAPAPSSLPPTAAASVQGEHKVQLVPATDPQPTRNPEENAPFEYNLWRRLNLVVGGGGSWGGRVYGEAEPFNLAAPELSGGMFLIQPTISLLGTGARAELPRGLFELRVGADFKHHWLSNSTDQGEPEVNVSATSVSGLVEGIVNFHRQVGVGANVNFGWMGFSSDNADVGAPYTATLDWTSDGGLGLGGQLFLTFWEGNLRVAGQINSMLGYFELDAGPGNPPLRTSSDPLIGFSVGADVLGIVRSLSEEKPKEKK